MADNDSHNLTLVERIQQDFPDTPALVVPPPCTDAEQRRVPQQYHYADITVLFDAMTTTAAAAAAVVTPLDELRDDELEATMARLGTRQHGSRLLQRLLQTLPPSDVQRLFAAGVRVLPALWTDPFGNYLAQALFDVAHPCAAPTRAAQRLAGHVAVLACDPYGCRVVQKALQCADAATAAALAAELRGRVCACAQDACGNHVLQRVAECVPLARVPFVAAELRGHAVRLARDRCACRVLQRLLEHSARAPALAPVLHELCAALPALLTDPFGGYVVQSVVAHGGRAPQAAVLAALHGRVVELARHPRAGSTVEACLVHADADAAAACVLPELAGGRGDGAPLLDVLATRPGAFVVARCLACFPPAPRARLAALVRHHAPRLRHRPHCRRVLALATSPAPSSSPVDKS